MANKSKRTPEVEAAILRAIEDGTPVKRAAQVAGNVNASTLYRWRVSDPEFDLAVQRARAIFLHRMIMNVTAQASEDWRAAAWMLERSDPATFGKRVEVELHAEAQPVRDLLTGEVLRESGVDQHKPNELGPGGDESRNLTPDEGSDQLRQS